MTYRTAGANTRTNHTVGPKDLPYNSRQYKDQSYGGRQ